MKLKLETVTSTEHRSFSLMFNPRLSDLYFWHFHPEYELVYIEAIEGNRQIGNHRSTFRQNDLVLIGTNIPHLNFDYGIKSEYRKVVVHFKKSFIEEVLDQIPELKDMDQLMRLSLQGLAFGENAKLHFGPKLFTLEGLSPKKQYVKLIEIMSDLAETKDWQLLHEQPFQHNYKSAN